MRWKILGDRQGSIGILAALSFAAVLGVAALAVEYGNGLLQRSTAQRVADLAAYGGALVYNATGSTEQANAAARNLASLNGLSGATATIVSSPTGDGNQAMQVGVTTSVPLHFARLLTSNTALSVGAASSAEMKINAPGCIIALSSSGTGIGLSGGATVSAPGCAVASNSTVTAHACSNTITTEVVDYKSSTAPPSCSLVAPPGKTSVQTNDIGAADPLLGNGGVTSAAARVTTVSAITSPIGPSVSSVSPLTLSSSKITGSLPAGCSTISTKSPWAITCTGSGTFAFGSLTLGGGASATFTNTSSGATYTFSGLIDSGTSNGLTFNGGSNATYKMAGGIYAHGTAPMSFGAGTFQIGAIATTSDCNSTAGYSICIAGSARVTFAGPSTFTLAGGIYQDASGMPPSAALNLGYGVSANSFNIGKASDGNSLNEANGATLFGDADSAGDLFQMAGSMTTSGGTCVAVAAAAEHDINGSVGAAGAIVLGSGVYTVNGYVALGNSAGGDVSGCPTSTTTPATGLLALDVTLVVSGATTTTCGSLASAFCLGAGYSHVTLTAPSSGTTANLAVIGPQSSSHTGAAVFTSGATNTRISGAFYFPNGQASMSGAAALHDTVDSGACLQLIATQVTLSAGSVAGTTCSGLGGGSTGDTVSLVE